MPTISKSLVNANLDNIADDGTYLIGGLSDILAVTVDGNDYLIASGATDGGLTVFSIGADGMLQYVSALADDGTLTLGGASSLAKTTIGGTTYIIASGATDHGVSIFTLDSAGTLSSSNTIADDGTLNLANASDVAIADIDGTSFLFVASPFDSGLSVFSLNDGGVSRDNVSDDGTLHLGGVSALTTAAINGVTYLFAAGTTDNGLSVFSVDTGGLLTNVDNLADDGTLALDGVSALETSIVNGTTYLFAAGADDNGVSVFSVGNDGTLTNVANATDDGALALAGATGLSIAEINGATYLFVAGASDNGITIYSVASGGTLTHIENLYDTGDFELAGASSLETATINGKTLLFGGGAADSGLSTFNASAVYDDTVTFTENGDAVVLSTVFDIADANLDAANSGNGDYDGATITIERNGGADGDDVFSFVGLNTVVDEGSTLTFGGNIIATVTNNSGTLTIIFTSANGSTPTSEIADEILRSIAYTNISDTPPASTQIDVSFDNGAGLGDSVAVESVNIIITAVNDAPVITNIADRSFDENTINAAPALLLPNIVIVDGEGNFDGGTLSIKSTVSRDTELLDIQSTGVNIGEISTTDTIVSYEGTQIGTYLVDRSTGRELIVTLNSSATTEAVQALARAVTYQNTSDGPVQAREISIVLTDADGANSNIIDGPNYDLKLRRSDSGNPLYDYDRLVSDPNFVDFDNDGDFDLLLGDYSGDIFAYENTGDAENPVFTQLTGTDNPFNGVNVSQQSNLAVADINGDDLEDVLVGRLDGTIDYYENTGTEAAPVYTQRTGVNNPFDGVDVGARSAPEFGDLNGDNLLDVLIADSSHTIRTYYNTGTAQVPVFTQQTGTNNPFDGLQVGIFVDPVLFDIDGDGDLDAITGTPPSGVATSTDVWMLENIGTNLAPVFAAVTDSDNPFSGLETGSGAAPEFVDINDDGLVDVFVGNTQGYIHFLENRATAAPITINVVVNLEADAPVLEGFDNATFTESDVNGSAQIIDGTLTVSDVESLLHSTLTVSGLLSEDVLTLNTSGNISIVDGEVFISSGKVADISGGNGADLIIAFNEGNNQNTIEQVFEAITYQNDSNTPTLTRTLQYSFEDSTGLTTSVNIDVTVTSENDAPSFTMGEGVVTTDIGTSSIDRAYSVIQLDDGGIVVAGESDANDALDIVIAKYNDDGSLDTGFGTGGIVTTNIGIDSAETGNSLTQLADGSLLVGGLSDASGSLDFMLAKYAADGSLDTSFGTGGIVTTDFGAGAIEGGYSVIQLADGDIVLGGILNSNNNLDFALARYNPDGSLDTSFGNGGIVTVDINGGQREIGRSVIQTADGGLLLAGESDTNGSSDFALVKYNNDGSLDTNFGTDGVAITDVGTNSADFAESVTQLADGDFVVAGYSNAIDENDFTLIRYNFDGSLDTSFGTDGIVTTDIGTASFDIVYSITQLSDGGLLVAGSSGLDLQSMWDNGNEGSADFVLVKYNANGSLDTTFGNGGIVTTDIGTHSIDVIRSVTELANGDIVAVGDSLTGGSIDIAIARYNANGTLDENFGVVSNTLDGTPSFSEGGAAVVLDNDVRIRDAELDVLNNGLGDYAGASLTILRTGFATGTYPEDVFGFDPSNATVTISGNNLQSNDLTFATFTSANGTLTLNFTSGETTATSKLVDSVLRAITYENTSEAPPTSVNIDWIFSDGNTDTQGLNGAQGITITKTVALTPINDAVIVDLNGDAIGLDFAASFTENTSGPVAITDTDAAISDVDDTQLASLTVAITNFKTGDVLAAAAAGGIIAGDISYDGAGTLTIAPDAEQSLADFQAVLRSVTFENTSDDPDTTDRAIQIIGNDGDDNSIAATTTLVVNATNDLTIVDLNGGATDASYAVIASNGDSQPISIAATDATLSDLDNTTLSSLTATISNFKIGDVLAATASGGILAGDIRYDDAGVLTIAPASPQSIDDFQAVLRSITYRSTEVIPDTADRLLQVVANDGDASIAAVSTISINLVPVIDLDGAGGTNEFAATFTEGVSGPIAVADSDATLTDSDHTELKNLLVFISNYQEGDVLAATASGGFTDGNISYDGSGVLIINPVTPQSVEAYQTILRSITFENTSDNPVVGERVIQVVARDGIGSSFAVRSTITVEATNDLPVLSDIEIGGILYQETGGAQAISTSLTLTDLDNDNLDSASIVFTSGFDANNDRLIFTDQSGITGSFDETAGVLTLSGSASVDDYQQALRSVSYLNAFNTESTDNRVIQITTNDGIGNSNSVTQKFIFNVDETFDGTAEAQAIDGGFGTNVMSYLFSSSAVVAYLGAGGALGDAAGDTYTNIQNLTGTLFDDRLFGDDNDNEILAGDGNDIIEGRNGGDTIYGGADNDTIFGGAGADQLYGNRGNDVIASGEGADYIDGGGNFDRVWYGTSTAGIDVDLIRGRGLGGDAEGDTYVNIERVTGSAFDDIITGTNVANDIEGKDGDDTIFGADGRDILEGQAGNDTLYGGNSNDIILGGDDNDIIYGNRGFDQLDGGLGDDELFGGNDVDYFRFNTEGTTGFGNDIIRDFDDGADRLDVRGVFSVADPNNVADGFSDFIVDQSALGIKIRFEAGQVIYIDNTLNGMTVDDVSADDFVFA